MAEQKPDRNRGMISFAFLIIVGLVIGVFIKKVQVGLIIGLALGLLASGTLKRR
jgi:uncharacterized membrane protein (UPF0136 family)